jgi:hypothetical protein
MPNLIAKYVAVAASVPLPSIDIGIGGITFFPHSSLDREQIGYEGEGWYASRLVVGYELAEIPFSLKCRGRN